MLWLLIACSRAPSSPPQPWEDLPGTCPDGLVEVPGRVGSFCIQPFEATFTGAMGNRDQGAGHPDGSTVGQVTATAAGVPTIGITWYQSAAACAGAGLHLCTSAEWQDACAGAEAREWPTPDGAYHRGACGVGEGKSGTDFPPVAGGSFPDCHTPEGVYNLLGNAWEWVDPQRRAPDGTPVTDKRGAARYSFEPARCSFEAVGGHLPSIEGTISFRCCAPLQD